MTQLDAVFAAIDAANAQDPTIEHGQPAALLYGRRMSDELAKLYPDAGEPLQIACRGQHVERWKLPRSDYPMDRVGYLQWRKEQGRRHAERVAGIMADAGYDADAQDQARRMLTKQGIKQNADVQALEDTACFTFIRWYLGDFSDEQPTDKLHDIVAKTARKMSPQARAQALREFAMPPSLAAVFHDPV